jgi:hypothetical protein
MKTRPDVIRFAGSQLSHPRHVCAFFNGDDDAYRVLLPFICDGFECGHKAVHIVNPGQRSAHMKRLQREGIDTASAEETGQLEVQTNVETYLQDGRFDQDRMVAAFENLASGNLKSPFPLSRIVCQMDWAADGHSHLTDLIEFEARVNDLWSRHDDAVICVYDLAKFGGDTIVDIMRTHPLIVIGGVLQENPFYMPPQKFLDELRNRRARQDQGSDTGG